MPQCVALQYRPSGYLKWVDAVDPDERRITRRLFVDMPPGPATEVTGEFIALADLRTGRQAAIENELDEYIGDPPPARTLIQSNFTDFDIEIDAILIE